MIGLDNPIHLVFLLVVQASLLAMSGTVSERDVISRRLQDIAVPTWEAGLSRTISVMRRRRYSRLPWERSHEPSPGLRPGPRPDPHSRQFPTS